MVDWELSLDDKSENHDIQYAFFQHFSVVFIFFLRIGKPPGAFTHRAKKIYTKNHRKPIERDFVRKKHRWAELTLLANVIGRYTPN